MGMFSGFVEQGSMLPDENKIGESPLREDSGSSRRVDGTAA